MGRDNSTLAWTELLRVAAIFFVIVIHSAAPVVLSADGSSAWWAANIYDSMGRWCIPVFIMISGLFLSGKASEKIGSFYLRRARKVLVPFIIWSAVYFLWSVHFRAREMPGGLIRYLTIEPAYYHLWFFYLIIGIYLIAPLLGVFAVNAGPAPAAYFMVLWFMWASVMPLTRSITGIGAPFAALPADTAFTFSGFFIAGYLLKNYRTSSPAPPLAVAGILVFLTAYLTFFTSRGGAFNGIFYNYTSPNVVLTAFAVFIFFRSAAGEKTSSAALSALSSASLGIYLVHAMVMDIFRHGALGFSFTEAFIHPAAGIPVFSAAVYLVSLGAVLLLRKIPLVKHALP